MSIGYYENNKLKSIDNKQEFDDLLKIIDEIKNEDIRKENLIEVSPIIHNNIEYKSFYDIVTKKREFYLLDNNTYKKIDDNTKKELDKIYNDELDFLAYSTTDNSKNNKKNKKHIKFKNKIIVAFLIASSAISTLTGCSTENHNPDDEIKSGLELSYNDGIIEDIIESNRNITQEEKDSIIENTDFFDDNQEYFNINNVKSKIENFEIIYDKDNQEKYNVSDNTEAILLKS